MGTVNQSYPLLNGIAASWADVVIKCALFDGPLLDVQDIQSINTSTSVEVGNQIGASGGRVMRRTLGSASQEASMTLYRSGYQTFIEKLAEIAPARGNERVITAVHFDIVYQYTPLGTDAIFERHIKGARVIGSTMNDTEGSDAGVVEVPLSVAKIVDIVNGLEVVLL